MTLIKTPCPICKKVALMVHPNTRVCGCTQCGTVFKYPSMVEVKITPSN